MSNLDFIVAKTRGMRGKIYEGQKLLGLCELPNVEDLAATLAPDEPVGDTIALQRHLTAQHVAALRKLLVHLDGWEADLFLAMLRRYQVENLKVLLRCWSTRSDESLLAAHTVSLPEELALPTRALMRCADMEALIKTIPVAPLREGAMRGLGDFEESGRLFFIEAGIDQALFTELKGTAARGKGPAREAVTDLISVELDIYNIMLVLRGLFNYAIPFNKIRLLLGPFGAHVGMSTLEELRHAPDIDAAAALAPVELVGEAEGVSGENVEPAMWRHLYRVANRRYYASVLDFGAVAAFYYIKRIELSNLITISEHLRHGQRGSTIRPRLIGLPQAAAAEAP